MASSSSLTFDRAPSSTHVKGACCGQEAVLHIDFTCHEYVKQCPIGGARDFLAALRAPHMQDDGGRARYPGIPCATLQVRR